MVPCIQTVLQDTTAYKADKVNVRRPRKRESFHLLVFLPDFTGEPMCRTHRPNLVPRPHSSHTQKKKLKISEHQKVWSNIVMFSLAYFVLSLSFFSSLSSHTFLSVTVTRLSARDKNFMDSGLSKPRWRFAFLVVCFRRWFTNWKTVKEMW